VKEPPKIIISIQSKMMQKIKSKKDIQIINGNQAAALAVKLCRVQVISAYPVTPQSPLSEELSRFVESGEMTTEYIAVESEHSALTVLNAASLVGARTFTATGSHGLAYMHELLHWTSGARLPVVMACVNRAIGAPWCIPSDEQDSVSQRDTGWVQIYTRNNQEILDTIIQAYKVAESMYVPVMVCFDGFVLSHTNMPVEIPRQADVDGFLPHYKPHTIIDPATPRIYNSVTLPDPRFEIPDIPHRGYMELRQLLHEALENAKQKIEDVDKEFAQVFGRSYGGMVWEYCLDDAEIALVTMGSLSMEVTVAVDNLRAQGYKVGMLSVRVFRPFPRKEVIKLLKKVNLVVVFEKNISYGYEGAVCSELKASLYDSDAKARVFGCIVGLGGRDVKARELQGVIKKAASVKRYKRTQEDGPQWISYL